MHTLTIYNYDKQGYFTNEIILDESDRNPKNQKEFLLPSNCTQTKPPKVKIGYKLRWLENVWQYEKVAKPENKDGFKLVWQNGQWIYTKQPISFVELKERRLALLKKVYLQERDKVRWLQVAGKRYGFSCKKDDVTIFCVNILFASNAKQENIMLKVFVQKEQTDVVEFTWQQLQRVFNKIRDVQFSLYKKYKNKKEQINKARNHDELLAVELEM